MRRLVVAAALLILFSGRAYADALVTLCATDLDAPRPGRAVNLSIALAAGGKITFDCPGPATILITHIHEIHRNTEIDGGGLVTLDGANSWIFFVHDDRLSFRLVDLSIVRAGRPIPQGPGIWLPGGVVRGHAQLQLVRVSVSRSNWPIWMYGGTTRIVESQFFQNDGAVVSAHNLEVLDHSRLYANRGPPLFGTGGRMVIDHSELSANNGASSCIRSTLRISGSRFNSHTGTRGGALNVNCDATIEESEFRGNSAENGGAIYVGNAAHTVSLQAVSFYDNRARAGGGAIGVESGQTPLTLELRHVTFEGNLAQVGGAIDLERSIGAFTPIGNRFLNAAAASFHHNEATSDGGAIHAPNAGMRITRGVFIENRAARAGGAIAALQRWPLIVELANSLLAHNRADVGAAFWGNAATFINTTIADNGDAAVRAQGPPLLPGGPPPGAPATFPLRFLNSILAGGSNGACGPPVVVAPYQDAGTNLQYPGATCGPTIPSASPALGPYYVPLFFSPALEAGNDAVCAAAPVARKDLYNDRRPTNKRCTIGAVEGSISHLINRWRGQSDVR